MKRPPLLRQVHTLNYIQQLAYNLPTPVVISGPPKVSVDKHCAGPLHLGGPGGSERALPHVIHTHSCAFVIFGNIVHNATSEIL